jgi:hypothetical protein
VGDELAGAVGKSLTARRARADAWVIEAPVLFKSSLGQPVEGLAGFRIL